MRALLEVVVGRLNQDDAITKQNALEVMHAILKVGDPGAVVKANPSHWPSFSQASMEKLYMMTSG